ncbi:MAG: ribosomal protein S18-alanine N-acetyltransferase [Pseudomonadota bacterium]
MAGLPIRIDGAGPEDAPALAALHKAAFGAEAWSEALIGDLLGQRAVIAFAARSEGAAAGLVLARAAAGEAEILTIGVDPARRRAGVARALMAAAAGGAAAAGAAEMFLEVSESNAAALALYRSIGFADAGRRAGYYADGSDALVLRRALTPRP